MNNNQKIFSCLSYLLVGVFVLVGLPQSSKANTQPLQKSYEHMLDLASQNKWDEMDRYAGQVQILNPAQKKAFQAYASWLKFKNYKYDAQFNEIADFMKENYAFPQQNQLKESAELALLRRPTMDNAKIWFENNSPITAKGLDLYLQYVQHFYGAEEMKRRLKTFWCSSLLNQEQQDIIYDKYEDFLREEDHLVRFNFLVSQGKYDLADELTDILPHSQIKLAYAKMALGKHMQQVDQLMSGFSSSQKNDPDLNYLQLMWYKKKKEDALAIALIENKPAHFPSTELMAKQRAYYARVFLHNGEHKTAYELSKTHGLVSGAGFAECEFLAGWISLKYMGQADQAIKHFENLYFATSTPMSKARAAYWLATAYDEKKNQKESSYWHQQAQSFPTTFYGQLSCQEQNNCKTQSFLKAYIAVDPERQKEFDQDLRRLIAQNLVSVKPSLSRSFIDVIASDAQTDQDYYLVAQLAFESGFSDLSTQIARRAINANQVMLSLAYPTLKELYSVSFDSIEDSTHALMHGVIRQESNFKADAVSGAGAKGLAQLLPSTAKLMSKKIGVPFSEDRLTSDPHYNVQMGHAYMSHLLNNYDGSHVLAIAAYNAGPGRIKQWVSQIGDPRHESMSEIDWIELIPYEETRNYVHRVLENKHIYHGKMGQNKSGVRK